MRLSGRIPGLLLIWAMGFACGVRAQKAARAAGDRANEPRDLLSYVDPFIGTGKSDVFTRWGSEGGTYPGAVAPWGMMQLTPETRAGGGYDYGDSTIYFFSCFHHLSGYPGGSAGQVKIMPLGNEEGMNKGNAAGLSGDGRNEWTGRPFRHRDEQASPGYYRVQFSDDHSLAEVTTSGRVGYFRFTFPAGVIPGVLIGGMGKINRSSSHSLQGSAEGSAFAVVVQYDCHAKDEEAVKEGLVLRWAASAGRPTVIVLRISVSGAGVESAKKNIAWEAGGQEKGWPGANRPGSKKLGFGQLETRRPGSGRLGSGQLGSGRLGFDGIKERTQREWRKELSVISIDDTNEGKKKIFYTALYHSLLLPWIVSDVEGKYRGLDGKVYTASGKNEYGQFSPWDTFRSLHPLLCLLYPDRQRDMVLSILDSYRQTGYLPIDPMTGNHAVAVIVDSWLKGIRGFDSGPAYKAMQKNLVDGPFLQSDMEVYHQRGYIPFTYPESVTRTVEYAYDDWVLGQFAGHVRRGGAEKTVLQERGYDYRNLFNPAELFFLPRDGSHFKLQPGTTGYKEGDKWVYSFFVPQHVEDLVNLMGGKEAFCDRLDSALMNQSIVFDNETVFQIPYLFNYAGRPDRTQYWVRTIMDKRFSAAPGGLPGNDDLGSMSSWYVLSAMGIYPVCPGRPFYDIGSPLFRVVRLHLAGGKQFVIRVRNERTNGKTDERNEEAAESRTGDARNIYVRSLSINGKRYEGWQIPHQWIAGGGEMEFEMGKENTSGNGVGLVPGKGNAGMGFGQGGDPDFRMLDFSLSKNVVAPHELLMVKFSLSNKGSIGTKIVRLLMNGKEVGRKNCLVAAGATVTDSMACRLYPYGMAELGIEGMKAVVVEVKRTEGLSDRDGLDGDKPGGIEISGLVIRPMLTKGALQKIVFTAQNIGGAFRDLYIPVKVNDSLVRTDSIVLGPGEKKVLSQELAIGEGVQMGEREGVKTAVGEGKNVEGEVMQHVGAGVRTIDVLGSREKFKVYDRDEESLLLDLSLKGGAGDSIVSDRSGFANEGRILRAEGKMGDNNAGDVSQQKSMEMGNLLPFGKDRYVEIPNSLSLDSMGETITMMAWVYPAAGGENLVDLFTKGDNNVIQVVDNKSLSFFAGGWGRGDCTVDLPANWLGHWHHIAGVCAGNTLRLYIDGEQKGMSRVEGSANLSGSNKWTLGRNEEFPGKRIFRGYMDQVRLYAAPLTGEEIRVIRDQEIGGKGRL